MALTKEQLAEKRRAALAAARAEIQRRKEAGEVVQRRKSRPSLATALKRHFLDLEGVTDYRGQVRRSTPDQSSIEGRAAARESYTAAVAAQGGSIVRAIKAVCFDCAADKSNPSPTKYIVRDCRVTSCPLHPVRPGQGLIGRKHVQRKPKPGSQTSITHDLM